MSGGADSAELKAKAQNTLQRVRAGLEAQNQLPLVGQIVRLIKDISGKADKMSVDELVDVISAEPTTLGRIMAIASSMAYNPGGGEITSLHHAISAIGFERVRHLAISILLLENAQSEFTAEANRELAGTSLISGMLAAEMGRRTLPVDPDMAFLCAALRSYGRMLIATFMSEDYARVMRLAAEGPTDDTFRDFFGLTPVELGHELLASQQLPRLILDSLVNLSPEARKQAGESPSAFLVAAADFSLRLADILQSSALTQENFHAQVETLSRQYDPAFLLTEETVQQMMERIVLNLVSFSTRSGISLHSVVLFRRLECLANGQSVPPPFRSAGRTNAPAVPPPPPDEPSPKLPERDELTLRVAKSLDTCIDTVTVLVREPHPDLGRIFESMLQALHRTLGLSSCLVFVKHRQSGLFRVTRGIGPLFQFARDTVAVDPTLDNIFSEAIKESRDILIRDPNEPALGNLVPGWLSGAGQNMPLLLLPIKNPAGVFALVCATCSHVKSYELAEKLQPELLRLRRQIALVGDILT